MHSTSDAQILCTCSTDARKRVRMRPGPHWFRQHCCASFQNSVYISIIFSSRAPIIFSSRAPVDVVLPIPPPRMCPTAAMTRPDPFGPPEEIQVAGPGGKRWTAPSGSWFKNGATRRRRERLAPAEEMPQSRSFHGFSYHGRKGTSIDEIMADQATTSSDPGKSVRFSKVEVRQYSLVLGGSGAAYRGGPQVALGPEVLSSTSFDLHEYETTKDARRPLGDMFVSSKKRTDMLLNSGYSLRAVFQSQKAEADELRKKKRRFPSLRKMLGRKKRRFQ